MFDLFLLNSLMFVFWFSLISGRSSKLLTNINIKAEDGIWLHAMTLTSSYVGFIVACICFCNYVPELALVFNLYFVYLALKPYMRKGMKNLNII